MRRTYTEEWDLSRWKQSMDSRGSIEEEEAYRRLSKYLQPVALKLLNSCYQLMERNSSFSVEEMAEDFVQETLMKIFQDYHRFEWRSHIKTYATKILQNEILEELRRSRTKDIPADFEDPDPESEEVDPISYLAYIRSGSITLSPEKILEQKEVVQSLIVALDQLSDKQRQALIKVTVEEKTVEQAAKELNITVDALFKNISRARLNLRKTLLASINKDQINRR